MPVDRGEGAGRRTVSRGRCIRIRADCSLRCHSCNKTKSRLPTIAGMVPALSELPEGCRFSNRCGHATSVCATEPVLKLADPDHHVACHHWRTTLDAPLLEVRGLTKHFPVRGGVLLRSVGSVHAVDGVSFSVKRGETLGLVGESGCGKTTVGKTLLRLLEPSAGTIWFEGRDITRLEDAQLRALRREIQIVFQDPFESLNARHSVGRILEEPFVIHRLGTAAERRRWVAELLENASVCRATRRNVIRTNFREGSGSASALREQSRCARS